MADPICTCRYVTGDVKHTLLKQCSLCKAAPEMYKALHELAEDCRGIRSVSHAFDALAHARGEK